MNKKVVVFIFYICFVFSLFALQLGDGSKNSTNEFIHVMDEVDFVYVGNPYATYIIKKDGSLWGTGEIIDFNKKQEIKTDYFIKLLENVIYFENNFIIFSDYSLWEYDYKSGLVLIDTDVRKISAGMYLKNDSSLWAYGQGYYGRFGNGKESNNLQIPKLIRNNVLDVVSSSVFSEIITTNNKLMYAGSSYIPGIDSSSNFFFIADNVKFIESNFFIDFDNVLYGFGYNGKGALGIGENFKNSRIVKIMTDVKSVSTSSYATLILKENGDVFGCGGGGGPYVYFGELGLGHNNPAYLPQYIMSDCDKIFIGIAHSAIIKKDGSLWVCGANNEEGIGY